MIGYLTSVMRIYLVVGKCLKSATVKLPPLKTPDPPPKFLSVRPSCTKIKPNTIVAQCNAQIKLSINCPRTHNEVDNAS